MTVVVTILALLTTIVAASVTGTAGSARESGKDGDMKNVDTAAARFESENPSTFPIDFITGSTNPSEAIIGADADGDGVITIKIDTSAADGSNFPGSEEVVCGTGSEAIDAALALCFGTIDFANDLVPDFLKSFPQHDGDQVTMSTSSSTAADLTITSCTPNGETCEFHTDVNVVGGDGLTVWNVDTNNNIVVLKSDADYGK